MKKKFREEEKTHTHGARNGNLLIFSFGKCFKSELSKRIGRKSGKWKHIRNANRRFKPREREEERSKCDVRGRCHRKSNSTFGLGLISIQQLRKRRKKHPDDSYEKMVVTLMYGMCVFALNRVHMKYLYLSRSLSLFLFQSHVIQCAMHVRVRCIQSP